MVWQAGPVQVIVAGFHWLSDLFGHCATCHPHTHTPAVILTAGGPSEIPAVISALLLIYWNTPAVADAVVYIVSYASLTYSFL
jgi:hypothetical protein